jgi:hypothetical protein
LRLDLPPAGLGEAVSAATLAARLAARFGKPSATEADAVLALAARYEAPLDAVQLGDADLAAEE